MDKIPWYNKTICTKLNGRIFEDYDKSERKDRYDFMFAVNAYANDHVSMPDDTSSGGGRPMPSTSPKVYFSHVFRQSTLLKIGFNTSKSIMGTE